MSEDGLIDKGYVKRHHYTKDEIDTKLDAIDAQIDDLQSQIDALEARIEALE